MKRDIFRLSFSYMQSKKRNTYANFNIGYLSTRDKALRKIEEYCLLPGFCDHPKSGFDIKKYTVDVRGDENAEDLAVYAICGEYDLNDEVTVIVEYPPVCGTRERDARFEKLKRRRRSIRRNEIFYTDMFVVDKSFDWSEGFVFSP